MRERPDREMTVRDWKALYLVWRLAEQIVLHGSVALDNFIDGCGAARAARGGTTE